MKRLILLSAMMITLCGCSMSNDEPIYNVSYSYDYEKHNFEVCLPSEVGGGTYTVSVSDYHYLRVANEKVVETELNGSPYRMVVENEFYRSTKSLYVYEVR